MSFWLHVLLVSTKVTSGVDVDSGIRDRIVDILEIMVFHRLHVRRFVWRIEVVSLLLGLHGVRVVGLALRNTVVVLCFRVRVVTRVVYGHFHDSRRDPILH